MHLEFLFYPICPVFALLYSKKKSKVKVQEKLNHENKQQWKKEHNKQDGMREKKEDNVEKMRKGKIGSERKGKDGQRIGVTHSKGVKKQKEGGRESRVSRVGMKEVEVEELGEREGCARTGTQSSGWGDV